MRGAKSINGPVCKFARKNDQAVSLFKMSDSETIEEVWGNLIDDGKVGNHCIEESSDSCNSNDGITCDEEDEFDRRSRVSGRDGDDEGERVNLQ